MGIHILDNIEINSSGVLITNAYVSVGKDSIHIYKNDDDTYTVRSTARLWMDKEASKNKRHIECIPISVIIPKNRIKGNPYRHIYKALKDKYVNTNDDEEDLDE